MHVARWGNSLAIRLPAAMVELLLLKEGDEIEIHVADSREFGISRKPGRAELLKRLRTFRGRLPADFRFDREAANARSVLRYRGFAVYPVREPCQGRWRGRNDQRPGVERGRQCRPAQRGHVVDGA